MQFEDRAVHEPLAGGKFEGIVEELVVKLY